MVDPTPEQVSALSKSTHEGPVHMINLLQFKGGDGLAGYTRYSEAAMPHLTAAGARIVAASAAVQTVIGDHERPWWDAIATVEYPSVQAFLNMVMSPEYQAITSLRTNALERAELIATAPGSLM
jgi:uncharacterized protein (DUF1330 family)